MKGFKRWQLQRRRGGALGFVRSGSSVKNKYAIMGWARAYRSGLGLVTLKCFLPLEAARAADLIKAFCCNMMAFCAAFLNS